jgi:hypothetical protein
MLFVFKDERTSGFPWHFLTMMKVVMVKGEEVMVKVVLIIDAVTYPVISSEIFLKRGAYLMSYGSYCAKEHHLLRNVNQQNALFKVMF